MYAVLVTALLVSSTLVQVTTGHWCKIVIPGFGNPVEYGEVNATVQCEDELIVSYYHSIKDSLFDTSFSSEEIYLLYECTNVSGDIVIGNETYRRSTLFQAPFQTFNVTLASHLRVSQTTCTVYGCFKPPSPNRAVVYLVNNASCQYGGGPTAETTTISHMTSVSMTTSPPPIETTQSPRLNSTTSFTMEISTPMKTTEPPPMTTAFMVTTEPPHMTTVPITTPPPITTSSKAGGTTDNTLTIIAIVVALVLISIVACLTCVTVRAKWIYRKKHSKIHFTHYSEAIDPYFNPINVSSRVKAAVSVVSVFDTFYPYHTQKQDDNYSQNDDDDKSVILQVANTTEENLSMKSIVCDNETASRSITSETSTESMSDSQEELVECVVWKNKVQQSLPDDADIQQEKDTSTEHSEIKTQNGYITSNHAIVDHRANLAQFQLQNNTPPPVNYDTSTGGYVTDTTYHPIQTQAISNTNTSEYVRPAEDVAPVHRALPSSLLWNRNENNLDQKHHKFRTQLSSNSSGYITETDLSTPTSIPDSLLSDTSSLERRQRHHRTYTILKNGYTTTCPSISHNIQQLPLPEEEDTIIYCDEASSDGEPSVYYEVPESEEDKEQIERNKIADQVYVENLLAECSLSLNPLHFEPIDNGYDSCGSSVYDTTAIDDSVYNCIPSLLSNETH